MRDVFNQQLKQLNQELIEMATLIKQAIKASISAFVLLDTETAKEIIDSDVIVDEQEKKIESLCLKLLLHQQPVASDLRQVSAALKMITDMERIGDHAADISELTIMVAKSGNKIEAPHLEQMATETITMLSGSIEAFLEKDLEKAYKVIHHDDVVDALFNKVRDDIIRDIQNHAGNGELAADLLMVAKYLERIGDHACNLSEWVIFSITGTHS